MCFIDLFNSPGDFVSTLVLLLTLIVLIFYAAATFGLRKTSIKQLELSMRPFVIIDVLEDPARLYRRLIYKNIGHGPAIDIGIGPFDAEAYILQFESYGLIEVGESKYLNPRGEGKDIISNGLIQAVPLPGFAPKDLDARNSNLELTLNIHYKNIENTVYQTKMRIDRTGISIQGTSKA